MDLWKASRPLPPLPSPVTGIRTGCASGLRLVDLDSTRRLEASGPQCCFPQEHHPLPFISYIHFEAPCCTLISCLHLEAALDLIELGFLLAINKLGASNKHSPLICLKSKTHPPILRSCEPGHEAAGAHKQARDSDQARARLRSANLPRFNELARTELPVA